LRIGARIGAVLAVSWIATGCATMPPERAARRSALQGAGAECQRSFPVVESFEVDSFDRLVVWYRSTASQREIDPFWQCVRDRTRQAEMFPPPAREPRFADGYYVNDVKGFRVRLPAPEWQPSLLRDRPEQVADVAFTRSGGFMVATASAVPDSFSFAGVNDWWIKTIAGQWGWTDIATLEQRDLTIARKQAKFVSFEFSDRGTRRIEMAHHIWVPTAQYRLYRLRLTCAKPRCGEFVPAYQALVDSFSLLPPPRAGAFPAGTRG
jgi:hypothetical protein